MDDAALEVTAAVVSLRKSWATWATAWQVRCALGGAALFGGQLAAHRQPSLPAEVAAALDVIEDHLLNRDRLKADEAAVQAWRATEVRGAASSALSVTG